MTLGRKLRSHRADEGICGNLGGSARAAAANRPALQERQNNGLHDRLLTHRRVSLLFLAAGHT
jgi:hypothetical protein